MNAKIKEFLDANLYLTIATVCEDGRPWSSPMFFAYDEDYIYWWSPKNSVHQRNIERERGVAMITVFDSHAPFATGEGLYAEVVVEEINDKATHSLAIDAYNSKIEKPQKSYDKYYLDDAPIRIYRAKIVRAWTNDVKPEGKYLIDIREEIK
jgi:nitroimidazol reductase NimA-like FMN-containing flavoprotein (pyridoxamine 5'-phosphate oxidase superfamily)